MRQQSHRLTTQLLQPATQDLSWRCRHKLTVKNFSLARNRTAVTRVTGGYTNHYTTRECCADLQVAGAYIQHEHLFRKHRIAHDQWEPIQTAERLWMHLWRV